MHKYPLNTIKKKKNRILDIITTTEKGLEGIRECPHYCACKVVQPVSRK
jgi:hypothetical protein